MKKKLSMSLILLVFSTCVFAQYQEEIKKLDTFIKKGMEDWQVPGLAAVVVNNGEVIFKKTYGIKDIYSKEKVNEQTLFTMASTTKALIAISLGMLVDQEKISWDDEVSKHLAEFKLSDSYITNEARVKDLLTHNLGIAYPSGLWMDSLGTPELIKRFSLAKKGYPIRGGFIYQNTMYVIAGEIISRVSGVDWRVFIEKNILEPLEMTRTITRVSDLNKSGNYVSPHFNDYEDGIVKVRSNFPESYGAAGGLWSSISDMGKYMMFLLNEGIVNGDTLLKPDTFQELFKPQTLIINKARFYPTHELTHPNWTSYGLGWFQHDYRGNKLDFHTGSLNGLVAIAGLIHKKNIGVYVFANLDHAELRHAIMYKSLDLFAFRDDSRDWHSEIFDLYSKIKESEIRSVEKRDSSRILKTNLFLPLDDYTGTYNHDLAGEIIISVTGNQLNININNFYSLVERKPPSAITCNGLRNLDFI